MEHPTDIPISEILSKPNISLVLKSKKNIKHFGLIRFLESRGIPLNLAKQYFKELHVQEKETGKSFLALGFPSEEGGFELINPFFNGHVGAEGISFIRGAVPKPEVIHVYKNALDFLSVITQLNGKRPKGDSIILHSWSCMKKTLPYIQHYGYRYCFTWFENNEAGLKAGGMLSELFTSETSLKQVNMNKVYQPYQDVNTWHMQTLGLIGVAQ